MTDCVCDYDPPEFYRAHIRRARKPHTCEECGVKIAPGERYESVFGIWEGYEYTAKTCERCLNIRTFVKNSVPCFCWAHGNMIDDAKAAVEDAYSRAREEVRGLYMGYGRLVIARDRHNAKARAT